MLFKKTWKDITLYQFQAVDEINKRTAIDELDKMLFTTCAVFGLTEYQLDNKPVKKAQRLISEVSRIFSSEFNPIPVKKIGKYNINYDPSNLTLAQYVEISFFLQEDPIKVSHYVLSSLVSRETETHRQRSDYFLSKPVTKVIGSISYFIEQFVAFNKRYSDLFGIGKDEGSEEMQSDSFNKRYGWVYSASQIAEYERITLKEAFLLPVTDAFDDLAYLKAKANYDMKQLKNK